MSSERSPLLPVAHPVTTEPQLAVSEPQPAAWEPQATASEPQPVATEPQPGTSELGATPERGPYGWNNPGPMFKNAKRNVVCALLIYGIFYLLDRFVIYPNRYYVLEVHHDYVVGVGAMGVGGAINGMTLQQQQAYIERARAVARLRQWQQQRQIDLGSGPYIPH